MKKLMITVTKVRKIISTAFLLYGCFHIENVFLAFLPKSAKCEQLF